VPLLLVAHVMVVKVMGVVFLAAPLVLLFLPWERLGEKR
jgi:hypothetical protein